MKPIVRHYLKKLWPKTRRGWIIRIMVAMPILSLPMVEITSQSWFCNSCHIMGPYYSSWKTGPHKEVECVQCHIPPGLRNFVSAKLNGAGQVVDDVLARTNSKPSAEVPDESCTRSGCHSIDKVRTIQVRKTFFFDHGKHLGKTVKGIEIHCTTCHSHISGNQHFEVSKNACVTCHLITPEQQGAPVQVVSTSLDPTPATTTATTTSPVSSAVAVEPGPRLVAGATVQLAGEVKDKAPPRQCKACHEPPAREIDYHGLTVVHSEYVSYGARCESCHSGVTAKFQRVKDDQCFSCHEFGMEKMKDVTETHKIHSTGKKVECFSCHGVTPHGPTAQSMQLEQIDCRSCHQNQHAIQQNTYKKEVVESAHTAPDAPAVSPMFMAHVACSGCHVNAKPVHTKPDSGATVRTAAAVACDACHKPGLGDKMIPLWQKNTHLLYDGVTKMLPPATRVLDARQQQVVGQTRKLLDVVRLDGSWGVHNPRYTQKLLEQAQELIGTLDKPAAEKVSAEPTTGGGP